MAPTTWSSSRPVRASSKLRPGASVGWPTSTTTARSFCASGSQPTMSFTTSASGSITTTCMSSAATAWWTRCWASELFFTDAVAPPKDRRRVVESWDVADVQRFLHAAAGDRRYGPVWLVALHTGMRRGELLGLRWQDVDLDTGVLHVRQALSVVSTDDGPKVTFGEPKTHSGRRTIALDTTCVAVLREHRARQIERRLALGPQWREGDLVFTNEVGGPVDPMNLYHRFVALAKAGVSRIPLHGLRHTHATLLMKHGVNPKVVAERLGHADITLTLSTYSHVLPQMQQQATDVFAEAIRREGPTEGEAARDVEEGED